MCHKVMSGCTSTYTLCYKKIRVSPKTVVLFFWNFAIDILKLHCGFSASGGARRSRQAGQCRCKAEVSWSVVIFTVPRCAMSDHTRLSKLANNIMYTRFNRNGILSVGLTI